VTTKFSQRGGTQTLPPVCRSTVVLLPTFELPPYPPMAAYLAFAIRDVHDVLKHFTFHTTISWYHPPDRWIHRSPPPDYYIGMELRPYAPPQQMRIDIAVAPPNSTVHQFPRHGPAYTPSQPWTSGEQSYPHADPGEYCWSIFTTLP
jgi:hypothetical protein